MQHRRRALLLFALVFAGDPTLAQVGASGWNHYAVDTEQSLLRVFAYRGGLLGSFGHNHIISGSRISGIVSVTADQTMIDVDLKFDVADLQVDDPVLRRVEGNKFAGEVKDKDRIDTRDNMLSAELLDAATYPEIRLNAYSYAGTLPSVLIAATITVKGQSFAIALPATVRIEGRELVASGEAEIRQRDLGLIPYSIALGTVRVRDAMLIKYRIVASSPR